MAKEKSQSNLISQESIGFLEEVKKGKPRKFAMICKGPTVVSLVIYKKGNVEKRRKEAKEAGKGQFCHGMVDGKGVNIRFVLARADGYDSEPVKTASLKGFLADEADFSCKPYFEIVETAPVVLDEDDPLVARFLTMRPTAMQAGASVPDSAKQIETLCRQIETYLDAENAELATKSLDELAGLLKDLNVNPNASSSPAPKATPPVSSPPGPQAESPAGAAEAPGNSELETKLTEALKKLKPLLDQAIQLHPGKKGELAAAIVAVRDQLKQQLYKEAQVGIIALAKSLKELTGGAVATPAGNQNVATTDNPAGIYQSKLAELTPLYEQALQGNLGDTSKFRSVMAFIVEQGTPAGYAKANLAIDKLLTAVTTALQTAGAEPQSAGVNENSPAGGQTANVENVAPPVSQPVAEPAVAEPAVKRGLSMKDLSKARIELEKIHRDAMAAIDLARELVSEAYAEDAAQASEVAQACSRLNALLSDFRNDMIDKLDDVLVAAVNDRQPLAEKASKSIEAFLQFIEADPVANALDGNEFATDTYVIEPLKIKLAEIIDILS